MFFLYVVFMPGINAIEGIKVAVEPDMTSLAIVSSNRKVSVLAVAAIMEKSGWVMERQQLPESLHVRNMRHA